jgi:hypothetical protein
VSNPALLEAVLERSTSHQSPIHKSTLEEFLPRVIFGKREEEE